MRGHMDLLGLPQTGDELATKDAMWAVLTGPLATARAWDQRRASDARSTVMMLSSQR
jgi:hypothetical protein